MSARCVGKGQQTVNEERGPSVSYTHLDVYKRQPQDNEVPFRLPVHPPDFFYLLTLNCFSYVVASQSFKADFYSLITLTNFISEDYSVFAFLSRSVFNYHMVT